MLAHLVHQTASRPAHATLDGPHGTSADYRCFLVALAENDNYHQYLAVGSRESHQSRMDFPAAHAPFLARRYLPDGTFGVELVEIALKTMVRAQEHLLVVGRQSSLEKVSIFLAEILERQGGGDVIDLPMSRTDICDHLGLTIEKVSRSISKLRDMGAIRLRSARCVVVLTLDELHQIGEHS